MRHTQFRDFPVGPTGAANDIVVAGLAAQRVLLACASCGRDAVDIVNPLSDIAALIKQQIHKVKDAEWQLVSFDVATGSETEPRCRLTLRHGDEERTEDVTAGDGPVYARRG